MKKLLSVILLLSLPLLSGCGRESGASSKTAANVECAIEIQIAVGSGQKPGGKVNDGDWHVAASCVLPVRSTGGPGAVVSNANGIIVRIRWNDVRRVGDGIVFDGFDWSIDNRIVRRDGVSHTFPGTSGKQEVPQNNKRYFGTDFEALISAEIDTALNQRSGRQLVIRGRLLASPPPAQPLKLEEAAGL